MSEYIYKNLVCFAIIINKRKIEKNIISYDFPLKFYPERILGVFLQPQLLLLQIFLEILPRITLLALGNLFRRSGCNNRSTAFAAFRTDINDIISGFDNIQIVLNNYNRISTFTQPTQNIDQTVYIRK